MYNPYSLEGKTILITGASSGIGQATAIECSKMGATVIITARDKSRLNHTFELLEGSGHQILTCDLNDNDQIISLTKETPEIQGLVSNAGYTKIAPLQFIDGDDLKEMLQVNTVAHIMLLKNLVKEKKIKKGASIVFTSSLASLGYTTVGNSMYTACKGAISAFVKATAKELASKNIRVNAVCPGMIETNILNDNVVSEEQLEEEKKKYPLKRYGKSKEVAWAMIYLLSDASAWTTGTNLVLDGGYSIR